MSAIGSPRVHPLIRILLLVVIFGGLVAGFTWTVLHRDSKPSISLETSVATPGRIVSMRIRIPPDVPGDGVSDWIYGYTADLSRWTGRRWEKSHTLFMAMEPEGTFSQPGYTRRKNVLIMTIGFFGSRTVQIEIPAVAPGLYRVTMEFGYDATEQRPEAVVHDTIEVAD